MRVSDGSIISVTAAHLPQLVAVERACFQRPWSEQALAREIGAPCTEFFAVCEGGELVGFCILKKVLDEAEIYNIAVLPEKRRRGFGGVLLAEALRRAAGAVHVYLEVRESNVPAIALYERFGFAKTGRRRGYYDDPAEDAILMTKGPGV